MVGGGELVVVVGAVVGFVEGLEWRVRRVLVTV